MFASKVHNTNVALTRIGAIAPFVRKKAFEGGSFSRELAISRRNESHYPFCDKENEPIRVYMHTLNRDYFSMWGATEEMLEKIHRISSSISLEETTFTNEIIKGLNRKELQKICKAIGVNQTSKSAVLSEKIIDHMERHGLPGLTFHPFCNKKKPNSFAPGDGDLLSIELSSRVFESFGRVYQGTFPSVTTVLNHTKPEADATRLENWEKKEIKRLGKEKFDLMMKSTLDNGQQLHKIVADWLKEAHMLEKLEKQAFHNDLGLLQTSVSHKTFRQDFFKRKLEHIRQLDGSSLLYNQLKSLFPVLIELELVAAVESGVVSNDLGFAGTCDCIAVYKDELCIFDWKTSKKKRKTFKSCRDYPIQLAAYAGAVNHDPAYTFSVDTAAIVFAYEDGSPADVHKMIVNQCEQYWDQWQSRLQLFKSYFAMPRMEEEEHKIVNVIDSNKENDFVDEERSMLDENGLRGNDSIDDNAENIEDCATLLTGESSRRLDSQASDSDSAFYTEPTSQKFELLSPTVLAPESGPTVFVSPTKIPLQISSEANSEQNTEYNKAKLSVVSEEEMRSREETVVCEIAVNPGNFCEKEIVEDDVGDSSSVENFGLKIKEKLSSNAEIKVHVDLESDAKDEISNYVDNLDCGVKLEDSSEEPFISSGLDSSEARSQDSEEGTPEKVTFEDGFSCNLETVENANELADNKAHLELQNLNFAATKQEYPKHTTASLELDTGKAGQFAAWYIKEKFDSAKKYINSFWYNQSK